MLLSGDGHDSIGSRADLSHDSCHQLIIDKVQDVATAVLDDEEAVQQSKLGRRHRDVVERWARPGFDDEQELADGFPQHFLKHSRPLHSE